MHLFAQVCGTFCLLLFIWGICKKSWVGDENQHAIEVVASLLVVMAAIGIGGIWL